MAIKSKVYLSFNQVRYSLWKANFNFMELKSKPEEDIEEINKFTSFQLPNKFKIMGLVVFIVSESHKTSLSLLSPLLKSTVTFF